jgi:hypothetical protein
MDNVHDFPEPFLPMFEPFRYVGFWGGRGSAKSHSVAAGLLGLGTKSSIRVLCGREVQKSIKDSVKLLLDDKIEALHLQNFYSSTRDEIRAPNGTTFLFAGMSDQTIDSIKSFEGVDIFWGEEAQTFTARSLEILRPTIRKPGSKLIFTWNPRAASDAIDRFLRGDTPPPNSSINRVNYDDNPFFPDELKAEREHDRASNPVRYAHIWDGEYEPAVVGAIWDMATINEGRRAEAPDMERIVVSIDPAVSSEELSNHHGVVVAGRGADDRAYVLEDGTLAGKPEQWAKRAIALYDKWDADSVVIEVNQGGDMCEHTLRAYRPDLPIRRVHASRGKHVRAEPISAQYSLGNVSHVGAFPELEAQMCQMTAAGYEGEGSPDRVDALVWGMTDLFPKGKTKTAPKPLYGGDFTSNVGFVG